MEPSLIVIGVNLKTAPSRGCERFCIEDARRHDALHSLVRSEGVEEAIILSTPERSEFIVWASDVSVAANSILRFLTREFDLKLCEWSEFYRLMDQEALLHVFRTACALDADVSPTTGLAEMAAAWHNAQISETTGHFLDAIMQRALELGERLRIESRSQQEAETLVREIAAEFCKKLCSEQAVPTIVALRNRLDEICRQELANLGEEFGPFTEDQRQALNKLASHITQRIAGTLARELKERPERADQETLTSAVQRLFHLEMESLGVPVNKN